MAKGWPSLELFCYLTNTAGRHLGSSSTYQRVSRMNYKALPPSKRKEEKMSRR